MRRLLLALALLFAPSLAFAQCNPPSGWLIQNGQIALGDTLVLGPGCGQVQDGGPLGGSVTTNVIRSYLSNCTLSNDHTSDTNNQIAMAPCSAVDSTSTNNILTSVAITQKQVNVLFGVGSNAGCLDTGVVGNATYWIYAIVRTDTNAVDVLCSLSASAPTLPSPYTKFRRVGGIFRTAGANVQFVQDGDLFSLIAPVQEINGTTPAGTAATTVTLTGIPIGVRLRGVMSAGLICRAQVTFVLYSDLSINDTALNGGTATATCTPVTAGTTSGAEGNGYFEIMTNASGQIRERVNFTDANTFRYLTTWGWLDSRGQ